MRVIVADDSLLFREGVVRLLEDLSFEVVAQVDNAADLVRRVGGLHPDVALVDIRMPPSFTDEGIQAALQISESHPGVGVVVLSRVRGVDVRHATPSAEQRGPRISAQGPS